MKLAKILSTFFILIVLLISCEENIERNKCLLLKVTVSDGNSVVEYTYDNQNRVISEQSYIDGNPIRREEYSYNQDEQLATINAYGSDITIHYYYQVLEYVSDEKIMSYSYRADDSTLTTIEEFTYNGSDCGYVDYKYISQIDNTTYTSTINHLGGNCDLEFETLDNNGNVYKTISINDDKNGAYYWSELPHIRDLAKHNPIEQTIENVSGNIDSTFSFTAEYEYNLNNYPIRAVNTYLDGNVRIIEYEYDCI